MVHSPSTTTIDAQIGDVSGQVAVGSHILQIGSVHGGVVLVAPEGERLLPRARPAPASLRPRRPCPELLGRVAETDLVAATLQPPRPVEVHGPDGVGKTSLLRHLAHHPRAGSFPGGVVYLVARRQPVGDVLQYLFDACYECAVPYKPTDAQLRGYLQGKQVFVLLDDVDLPREKVEELLDAAPDCAFLLASAERRLWGSGTSLALQGLPLDDALALAERELGRPLTPQELPAARAICIALEGHPLRILQAAALVREEGRPLAQLAQSLAPPAAAEALTKQVLPTCPEDPRRRILAVLAALGASPVHAAHLPALAGLPVVEPALEELVRRGLVQADGAYYRLADVLAEPLRRGEDLAPVLDQALSYFTRWAEQHREEPGRLLEEADALMAALEGGAKAGRWPEVLRLARAVEGALVRAGRWGGWALVLNWSLEAARASGDRTAEAWALHQVGTRALCLDDPATARVYLTDALRLREALGDRDGAAVTRHNLDLLPGPRPDPGFWRKLAGRLLTGAKHLPLAALLVLVGLWVWPALISPLLFPRDGNGGGKPDPPVVRPAPDPVQLAGVQLEPAEVVGGKVAQGTLRLTAPAPADTPVAVSSSDPAVAQPPATVTIKAGQQAESFGVPTLAVEGAKGVTITARLGGESRPANLMVRPPEARLAELTLKPGDVEGGRPAQGTVTLDHPAPAHITVTLASGDLAAAKVPPSVTVKAGQKAESFVVQTSPVEKDRDVTITASLGGVLKSDTLAVRPAPRPGGLAGVELDPPAVAGGKTSRGTVRLSDPAPDGGAAVMLSSSNTRAARVPEAATVPAGQKEVTFDVFTSEVLKDTVVTITASLERDKERDKRSDRLTVRPIPPLLRLVGVYFKPKGVVGGKTLRGEVVLDGPAPAGGAVVKLSSSDPQVARVPGMVTVNASERIGKFEVQTFKVPKDRPVTITATLDGMEKWDVVTVQSPPRVVGLARVSLNAQTIVGGQSVDGTVTLDGPAPGGGAMVTLFSSDSAVSVHKTITVEAGQRSKKFNVRTRPVKKKQDVTITASYKGMTATARLTVRPRSPKIGRAPVPETGRERGGDAALTGPTHTGRPRTTDSGTRFVATGKEVP